MHTRSSTTRLAQWLALLWELPWPTLVIYLARAVDRLYRQWRQAGLYEVLAYESTLELLDTQGKRARFSKQQEVRYLQNYIIAFQDRIWSDGKGPLNYRCTPGKLVDCYRPAQTTILLISLRQSKQRGDVDRFHIEWEMHGSFCHDLEVWQTAFYDPTLTARISVIFPRKRPPQTVWGIEENTRRRHPLIDSALQEMPDGRWRVQWILHHPRQYERYNLHWRW